MSEYLLRIMAVAAALAASSVDAREDHAELFERLDQNGDQALVAEEVPEAHARLFDRLVRRADDDGDGRLSPAEFAAGLAPSTPPKPIQQEGGYQRPQANALKLLLLKLDTSGDAFLSRGEAPRELRDAYDQLAQAIDQDKDGEIAFRELYQGAGQANRVAGRVAREQRWNVDMELARVEREQGEAADRFDSQPDPRATLSSPQRVASLFKQLDGDGNGRLELEEVPEPARERFSRLFRRADRDRSGDLTLREMSAAAVQVSRLMNLSDRTSGAAKPASSNPPLARPVEMTDTMAEDAPPEGGTAERLVRRMVERMDKDRDGKIAHSEASGQLKRRFAAADGNSDGVLDRRELRQVAQRLQERLDKADKAARE